MEIDFNVSLANEIFCTSLEKSNKTILIATHNRDIAKKADYTLRLINGNIKRSNV